MLLLILWFVVYLVLIAFPDLLKPSWPTPKVTRWEVWFDLQFNPIGPSQRQCVPVMATGSQEAVQMVYAMLCQQYQGERHETTRATVVAVVDEKGQVF